ncbi:MAG TPA: TonB-dependent receptor [Balneolaceae bacterium]|nr:TonB-dependent receptor [Balneolaceae bacterium]
MASPAFAQTGIIKGQVTNRKQQPVPHINIALEGTHFGSAANQQGFYKIDGIPADTYTLVVTGVGYQTEKRLVTVENGETLTINVILNSKKQKLQEIVVSRNQINKYATQITSYVSKLPVKNINNPQVYNTVSSELLEDQVVTSFAQALTNAPGIFKLWESTGRGGDGAGYYSLRGFAVQPTMVNGLPSLTNGTLDIANVERIEVIKGPSGALYGSSLISYGGLINVVTEKPYNYFGGEVSYKTGSFGLNRIAVDVNTPIGDQGIALRVNGAYHTENSFQDAGFNKSLFIAPSLSYEVNERLSFLINTEYYQSESTNPTMLFLNRSASLVANNIAELNYNYNHSYTSNSLTISNPTFSLQAQMKYQLSDSWTSQTVLSRSSAKAKGYYSYLWGIADDRSDLFIRYINKQNSTTLGTDIQQNFIGDFSFAGMHNKMIVGVDYFSQRLINNSSGYVAFDQISLLNANPAGLSKSAVDTALAGAPINNITTQQKAYSAYISDVIHFTPRLSAMASLRIDYFDNLGDLSTEADNYSQTALSPKFGLVFQPIDEKLSLFANYMNGFSNVAPRIQGDGTTKTFEPEKANQWETGIKANLFSNKLTATVSYYNISVSNVVRPDPNRVNFYTQDGENYSRGLEASITAAPIPGLDITAGYSHNVSEITKTSNDALRGRRPEAAGPADLFNAWASYHVTSGALKGFGIGFGVNYASENMIMNRANTGVFTLPAFTIFDASVFYNTASYRIDLKVNNLSDEMYFKGWSTVNPQQPRSITAGFSYKF